MDPWAAFGSDDSSHDDEEGGDDDDHFDVVSQEDGARPGCAKSGANDGSNDHEKSRTWHESLARCVVSSVLGRLSMSQHTPRTRLQVGFRVVRHGASEGCDEAASCSPPISERLLRQLLKLQGVIVSDVDTAQDEDEQLPLWDALLVTTAAPVGSSAAVEDAGQRERRPSSLEHCLRSTLTELGQRIVVGGALMFICRTKQEADRFEDIVARMDDDLWERSRHSVGTTLESTPDGLSDGTIVALTKRLGRIQHETCPWLSRTPYQLEQERERVRQATVPVSANEAQSHKLTEASICQGVEALQSFGYCILPRLLSPKICLSLGALALEDLHDAARILQRYHGVDLYHPGGDSSRSSKEAGAYRELSLREDFRMDVRNGPRLDRVRCRPEHTYRSSPEVPGVDGNEAWVIRADTTLQAKDGASNPFLRGHPDVLEIVRRCMNPPVPQSLDVSGNWGRFNFSSSRPGTYQDVRVGRLGAIVSLPGAADQALHADTPHLYEIDAHLPPHYVNAFSPGAPSARGVGQTALVHGSHRLATASKLLGSGQSSNHHAWHAAVVRPRLEPGDVLLFDCRILHFGLANAADSAVERPILYANMTLAWFHDPKNWDDQQRIFPESD